MKKIRLLTRIAYFLVVLFCAFIGYEHIAGVYSLETQLINQNLNFNFNKLKDSLDNEVSNARATLTIMKYMVMKRVNGKVPFRTGDFRPVMDPLISSQKNQFNLYFSFNREFSQKFFNQDGVAYTVHKDKNLLGTESYNDPKTFILQVFNYSGYQNDETEVWYHAGKKSKEMEITDIYFDKSYMKVWMYSFIKGLYHEGKFVGVVGVDYFLDNFLKDMKAAAKTLNGDLFLVDNKTKQVFTQTKSKLDINSFSEKFIEQSIGKITSNRQIKDMNGTTYLLNSFPLSNFRWTIVSLTERNILYNELFSRIHMLLILGIVMILLSLIIVNYIFKFLNRTYLEIMAKNQSKGITRMTEGLCHEINNPLATLNLSHGAIKRSLKNPDPHLLSLIQKAENASERIAGLISKLRDISFSHQNVELRHIPAKEIFDELQIIFSEEMLKYKIDLTFKADPGAQIFCDPLKLIQVLLSLTENSIDEIKSSDERWIQLILETHGKIQSIKFIDSGKGIRKSHEQRIFLPFFTTKNAEMKKGLGLSIAQRMMEQQGGSLRLETDSKRTTFRVILPKSNL